MEQIKWINENIDIAEQHQQLRPLELFIVSNALIIVNEFSCQWATTGLSAWIQIRLSLGVGLSTGTNHQVEPQLLVSIWFLPITFLIQLI